MPLQVVQALLLGIGFARLALRVHPSIGRASLVVQWAHLDLDEMAAPCVVIVCTVNPVVLLRLLRDALLNVKNIWGIFDRGLVVVQHIP